jgi:hypothetical protein
MRLIRAMGVSAIVADLDCHDRFLFECQSRLEKLIAFFHAGIVVERLFGQSLFFGRRSHLKDGIDFPAGPPHRHSLRYHSMLFP